MQILSETITKMVEGELLQMSWEGDDRLNEQDYLAVITGKTASLMGAACQMGAVLATAPASWEGALARYGLEVGLAFQLVDDSLDYTATEEEFGKARGADLQEGKITLPLLKTLRRCTSTERAALEAVIRSTTPSGDGLAMVLNLIRRYGGLQETAEEARGHLRQAIEALAAFPASPDKEALISAATYVVERRR
jgi:octaprenyl-diphosphate synthase